MDEYLNRLGLDATAKYFKKQLLCFGTFESNIKGMFKIDLQLYQFGNNSFDILIVEIILV